MSAVAAQAVRRPVEFHGVNGSVRFHPRFCARRVEFRREPLFSDPLQLQDETQAKRLVQPARERSYTTAMGIAPVMDIDSQMNASTAGRRNPTDLMGSSDKGSFSRFAEGIRK